MAETSLERFIKRTTTKVIVTVQGDIKNPFNCCVHRPLALARGRRLQPTGWLETLLSTVPYARSHSFWFFTIFLLQKFGHPLGPQHAVLRYLVRFVGRRLNADIEMLEYCAFSDESTRTTAIVTQMRTSSVSIQAHGLVGTVRFVFDCGSPLYYHHSAGDGTQSAEGG
jgi:hypothetical protein